MAVSNMKQQTFSDIEYGNRKRKTRRERFLDIMEDMIPSDRQVVNGEEEDVIDLDALIAMSAEDIQQLMTKREVEVNRENEAAF